MFSMHKASLPMPPSDPCKDYGELLIPTNSQTKEIGRISKRGKVHYSRNRCRPCICESEILQRHFRKDAPDPDIKYAICTM